MSASLRRSRPGDLDVILHRASSGSVVRLARLWVTVANLVTVAESGPDTSLLSYVALDEHVEDGEQTFLLKRLPVGVAVEVSSISDRGSG
jgi:uncharacterized protein (UPF0548 family)